jgi:hypothetical protein
MKLPKLPKRFTKFTSKFKLGWMLPAAALLVLIVSAMLMQKDAPKTDAALEAYKNTLQSQVDTDTGEPRSGRDPSSQQQGSLAAAASNPTGAGSRRTDNPASGVSGNNSTQNDKSDVYGDPNQTGINAAGCFYDYSEPGACVQAHYGTNGVLTCSGVHSAGFHNGVRIVTGNDRFNLDTDHDGIACE